LIGDASRKIGWKVWLKIGRRRKLEFSRKSVGGSAGGASRRSMRRRNRKVDWRRESKVDWTVELEDRLKAQAGDGSEG